MSLYRLVLGTTMAQGDRTMRMSRWVAGEELERRGVLYHCVSRVVDRRRVLGDEEKEMFRRLMRMQEAFTGCRVGTYALMDDHVHLLLKIPAMRVAGLTDVGLLERLAVRHPTEYVAGVAAELAEARWRVAEGLAQESEAVTPIHSRFTYRMHSLGQFMKGLLQPYTQWHNRIHRRSGRLWESRYTSVIVEEGLASRVMAAYIDLNPVRAGVVDAPGDSMWTGYGEALSDGRARDLARCGLVLAWGTAKDAVDAGDWTNLGIAGAYERMLVGESSGMSDAGEDPDISLNEIPWARILRKRIRYFTCGTVIGSRDFVDASFRSARSRFGSRRTSGARRMRGDAEEIGRYLWALRDLRKGTST